MDAVVECQICPKLCRVAPGQSGECRIRVNIGGSLRAVTYGFPSALHVDPIEKKPLFHFKPGTRILSVATAGCNLHCKNCQNWELSQTNPEDIDTYEVPPEALVGLAGREGCPAIAYTYSEPLVWYEYMLDSARLAREQGLDNVLVTAGYANAAPARELFGVLQATNVDIKFFDDRLYGEVTGATLAPILSFAALAKEMGVWVELTNLVIPTLSDDDAMVQRMCRWIAAELGPDTPLHLSRFHPQYKLENLPPTPVETLVRLREVARAEGLRYVYVGNVPGGEGETTRCPADGTLLVERYGYTVKTDVLSGSGQCPTCEREIAGVWR